MTTPRKINMAIFASGKGSNAQALLAYFKDSKVVNSKCLYSNNPHAYALKIGTKFGLDTITFSKNDFYKSNDVVEHLNKNSIDLIVLAGFMWLIPSFLIEKFTIINIHPALLPNFGGKGMYGHFVHRAVINSGVKESGITIHYVNEEYDKGSIIYQKTCAVLPDDSPETLAARVLTLEHKYYPESISKIVDKLLSQQ